MAPVIVAGMHRSGTSATARLLQRLGLGLGAHLLGPSPSNVHGHFEEMSFVAFHISLLQKYACGRAAGCDWLPLALPRSSYDKADLHRAALLWQSHLDQGGTAWKDPRTSLFLDLWLRVVPQARLVLCLRHPYDIHRSLLRRGETFFLDDYAAALRGWALYNGRILDALASLPRERIFLVEMEALNDAPKLARRLGIFLGTEIPDDAPGAIDAGQIHFALDEERRRHFAAWFPELETLRVLLSQGRRAVPPPPPDEQMLEWPMEERLAEFELRCGFQEQSRRDLAGIASQARRPPLAVS